MSAVERNDCPFCHRVHYKHPYLNTICPCGAKYYVLGRYWLNRKTGEKVWEE